jgi:pimeloyl-ACP methyl ester carboxylesterase
VSKLRRRTWLVGAALIGLVATALIGLVSWHFSGLVVIPDRSGWPEDVRVEAVTAHRVALERSDETLAPGFYGLTWQGGHAIAGPILARDDDTVTRRLVEVDGYLVRGLDVGLDWNVFAGNPRETLHLPFTTVQIRGELGPMPAWKIPGPDSTWAIIVHGINSSRQTGLRVAPVLHSLGFPSLLISYRDDVEGPSSPDGYHHMGLTEWRDLQAAARYALSHGARRLVLVGYSMGGAIVAQFMERSALAGRVEALILDAPALDWQRTIEFRGTEMGFPSFATVPVQWAVALRIDADWSSLDALQHTEDFHLPILLFHGEADDWVPIETSDEFAEALPAWVTYYRVPRAGHTHAWNVNPPLYERRVRSFFKAHTEPEPSLK